MAETRRYAAFDRLRGLLIANMALGHGVALTTHRNVAEFWFVSGPVYAANEQAAFLVRLFTQSAAPMFFLLMGLSMALLRSARLRDGWSELRVARWFVMRGALLIAFQFTVVNLGWRVGEGHLRLADMQFADLLPAGDAVRFHGVLFALGVSMIATAALIRLRDRGLLALALVVTLSPIAYLPSPPFEQVAGDLPSWIGALAVPGRWTDLFALYTPVPWLGMTLFGVVLGRAFLRDRDGFARLALRLGIGAGGLLAVGFIASWAISPPGSVIEALTLTRYPPEPLLLLYAASVNLMLIWLFSRIKLGALDTVLQTFGRTALFFYACHLYVFAAIIGTTRGDLAEGAAHGVLTLTLMLPVCLFYLHYAKPGAARVWSMITASLPIATGGGR